MRSYAESNPIIGLLGNASAFFLSPVLGLVLLGGVSRTFIDHILQEQAFSFRAIMSAVRHRGARLLGAALVGWLFLPLGLGLVGLALSLGAIFATEIVLAARGLTIHRLAALGGISFFAALGVTAGLFLFLQLYGRVVMIPASVAIEEQPVGRAIRRAFLLGRGNWWKVLGILAFEYCLAWSVSLALAAPLLVVAVARGYPLTAQTLDKAAMTINVLLEFGSICSAPVALLAFSMLYFDSRVRKEGFDIQYLLRSQPSVEASMFATPTPSD